MECLNKDLEFGGIQENNLLPIFRGKFDALLCKTNKNAIVDYISPKTTLELKSRNCKHNTYDSVMIGKNKIDYAILSKKKVILAFNYIDGVYYYEFKKEDVDNGNIEFKMGGRVDRGRDERKIYAFINTSILQYLCERP